MCVCVCVFACFHFSDHDEHDILFFVCVCCFGYLVRAEMSDFLVPLD